MIDALISDFVSEEVPVFLDADLISFMHRQSFPSFIKLSTGQYYAVNTAFAERGGMQEEDYVGLTAYDIQNTFFSKPEMIKKAVDTDNQIFSGQSPLVCYQQALSHCNHDLIVEEVIKKPIFDKNNQIAGLFGHGNSIAQYAHPVWLFNLYEFYYPVKEAIFYFLKAKKIGNLFERQPTRKELLTLLSMRDNSDIQFIAHQLQCSSQAVKKYQTNLSRKLKFIDIEECLVLLSSHSEAMITDAIGWE
jgi:hypothetical protein